MSDEQIKNVQKDIEDIENVLLIPCFASNAIAEIWLFIIALLLIGPVEKEKELVTDIFYAFKRHVERNVEQE